MPTGKKGIVLISGASTGIGRATALMLQKAGYQVFAGIRNPAAGEALRSDSSDNIIPLTLDITSSTQITRALEAVKAIIGPDQGLTALVNNAGITVTGPLEHLPLDDFRHQLEVNLVGHLAMTQAFLPLLHKARGRIVNIGSTAAYFAAPFLGAYSASKFALEAVSDTLRRELALRGIKVILIEPGYTETPIWDKGYAEIERMLAGLSADSRAVYAKPFQAGKNFLDSGRSLAVPPEAIAKKVLRAITDLRPKVRYLVGTDTHVAALLDKLLPDFLADKLVRIFLGK